jgi:hypothetical protein
MERETGLTSPSTKQPVEFSYRLTDSPSVRVGEARAGPKAPPGPIRPTAPR